MNKNQIEKEFDKFFEFPGEDRSVVTSVSAKLFARHCIDKYMAENNDLTIAYMSGAASRDDEIRELVRERDELKTQIDIAIGALHHYMYGGSNYNRVARDALSEIERVRQKAQEPK